MLVGAAEGKNQETCTLCGEDGHVVRIRVPFVFRYLTAELAAMGIRLVLDIQRIAAGTTTVPLPGQVVDDNGGEAEGVVEVEGEEGEDDEPEELEAAEDS